MSHSGEQTQSEARSTDIGAERLARVYAQAILDAADSAGCRGEVLGELRGLAFDVLPKVPGAIRIFGSPRVTAEDKSALIDRICGPQVRPTTLHSLHVLARHGRLGMLPEVVEAAARLADERDGLRRAEFITAVPLEATDRERIVAETSKALGVALAPTFTVNPDLLGGLVVRVEDTVYDQSVATSLRRLGDRLKQRSIHEIQYRRDRLGTP